MVRFGGTIALLALVLAPSPALGQIDLSGSWGAHWYHEDFPERIPGPELANFLGLPINESARQMGPQLGPFATDAARAPVSGARVAVHLSGASAAADLEERDTRSQKLLAIKNYISTYEQRERSGWTDVRIRPSTRPHVGGGSRRGSGRATC